MQVRLTDGLKAGSVIEVDDSVGLAFLNSGKAVRVDAVAEVAEVAETPETPEKPKRRARHAKAAQEPETR